MDSQYQNQYIQSAEKLKDILFFLMKQFHGNHAIIIHSIPQHCRHNSSLNLANQLQTSSIFPSKQQFYLPPASEFGKSKNFCGHYDQEYKCIKKYPPANQPSQGCTVPLTQLPYKPISCRHFTSHDLSKKIGTCVPLQRLSLETLR